MNATLKTAWIGLCALVILLLGGGCAHLGETSQNNRILGLVLDNKGTPLAGMKILAEVMETEFSNVLITDPNGHFELSSVNDPSGKVVSLASRSTLRFSAWKEGFEPRELSLYYLGGVLNLEPWIMQVELLDVEFETSPGLLKQLELPGGPVGGSLSGRGE